MLIDSAIERQIRDECVRIQTARDLPDENEDFSWQKQGAMCRAVRLVFVDKEIAIRTRIEPLTDYMDAGQLLSWMREQR